MSQIVLLKAAQFGYSWLNRYREMSSEMPFSTVFRDNFRTEVVVSDVISSMAVEEDGLDVRIKFPYSTSNRS